jgi:hypothetical protein
MTGEDKSDCNRLLLAIQFLLHALLAQTGALSRRRRKPGVILGAMLEPFGLGVNLFFTIAMACLVVSVGLRLFRQ